MDAAGINTQGRLMSKPLNFPSYYMVISDQTVERQRHRENLESHKRERTGCGVKGVLNKMWNLLSSETLEAGRQWDGLFEMLRNKSRQPGNLYQTTLSFKNNGEMKTSPSKPNTGESACTRCAPQETFERHLQAEIRGH